MDTAMDRVFVREGVFLLATQCVPVLTCTLDLLHSKRLSILVQKNMFGMSEVSADRPCRSQSKVFPPQQAMLNKSPLQAIAYMHAFIYAYNVVI